MQACRDTQILPIPRGKESLLEGMFCGLVEAFLAAL
jgi:hypothetical protein